MDGMLTNSEWYWVLKYIFLKKTFFSFNQKKQKKKKNRFLSKGQDIGDIFPYDNICLLILDTFLFAKTMITASYHVHSIRQGFCDIKGLGWAILQVL